ncbi:MAG: hypothetical protein JNN01_19855 [Opitutaceae bacterium]|nr:hypothetical protein [Opitutaceae bacterium]
MKKRRFERIAPGVALGLSALALAGCGTVGGAAADLGLAGAGGVAGYHLSDHKVGGAAAGAVVGYAASRIAQSHVKKEISEAEQRGYDRAMNQAVKQHYWAIQAQQRSRESGDEPEARLVPVIIPETTLNGVTTTARVEYLRVQ